MESGSDDSESNKPAGSPTVPVEQKPHVPGICSRPDLLRNPLPGSSPEPGLKKDDDRSTTEAVTLNRQQETCDIEKQACTELEEEPSKAQDDCSSGSVSKESQEFEGGRSPAADTVEKEKEEGEDKQSSKENTPDTTPDEGTCSEAAKSTAEEGEREERGGMTVDTGTVGLGDKEEELGVGEKEVPMDEDTGHSERDGTEEKGSTERSVVGQTLLTADQEMKEISSVGVVAPGAVTESETDYVGVDRSVDQIDAVEMMDCSETTETTAAPETEDDSNQVVVQGEEGGERDEDKLLKPAGGDEACVGSGSSTEVGSDMRETGVTATETGYEPDQSGDPLSTGTAGDPLDMGTAGDPLGMGTTGDPLDSETTGDPLDTGTTGDPLDTGTTGDPLGPVNTGDPLDTGTTGDPLDTGTTGDPLDTGTTGDPLGPGNTGDPLDTGTTGDPLDTGTTGETSDTETTSPPTVALAPCPAASYPSDSDVTAPQTLSLPSRPREPEDIASKASESDMMSGVTESAVSPVAVAAPSVGSPCTSPHPPQVTSPRLLSTAVSTAPPTDDLPDPLTSEEQSSTLTSPHPHSVTPQRPHTPTSPHPHPVTSPQHHTPTSPHPHTSTSLHPHTPMSPHTHTVTSPQLPTLSPDLGVGRMNTSQTPVSSPLTSVSPHHSPSPVTSHSSPTLPSSHPPTIITSFDAPQTIANTSLQSVSSITESASHPHAVTCPLPDSPSHPHTVTSSLPDSPSRPHAVTSPLLDSSSYPPTVTSPLNNSPSHPHTVTSPLNDSPSHSHTVTSPLCDSSNLPTVTSPLHDSPSHPPTVTTPPGESGSSSKLPTLTSSPPHIITLPQTHTLTSAPSHTATSPPLTPQPSTDTQATTPTLSDTQKTATALLHETSGADAEKSQTEKLTEGMKIHALSLPEESKLHQETERATGEEVLSVLEGGFKEGCPGKVSDANDSSKVQGGESNEEEVKEAVCVTMAPHQQERAVSEESGTVEDESNKITREREEEEELGGVVRDTEEAGDKEGGGVSEQRETGITTAVESLTEPSAFTEEPQRDEEEMEVEDHDAAATTVAAIGAGESSNVGEGCVEAREPVEAESDSASKEENTESVVPSATPIIAASLEDSSNSEGVMLSLSAERVIVPSQRQRASKSSPPHWLPVSRLAPQTNQLRRSASDGSSPRPCTIPLVPLQISSEEEEGAEASVAHEATQTPPSTRRTFVSLAAQGTTLAAHMGTSTPTKPTQVVLGERVCLATPTVKAMPTNQPSVFGAPTRLSSQTHSLTPVSSGVVQKPRTTTELTPSTAVSTASQLASPSLTSLSAAAMAQGQFPVGYQPVIQVTPSGTTIMTLVPTSQLQLASVQLQQKPTSTTTSAPGTSSNTAPTAEKVKSISGSSSLTQQRSGELATPSKFDSAEERRRALNVVRPETLRAAFGVPHFTSVHRIVTPKPQTLESTEAKRITSEPTDLPVIAAVASQTEPTSSTGEAVSVASETVQSSAGFHLSVTTVPSSLSPSSRSERDPGLRSQQLSAPVARVPVVVGSAERGENGSGGRREAGLERSNGIRLGGAKTPEKLMVQKAEILGACESTSYICTVHM